MKDESSRRMVIRMPHRNVSYKSVIGDMTARIQIGKELISSHT